MLNPSFSQSFCDDIRSPYVAPESIVNRIVQGNQTFDTGVETRLHAAYGEELWLKLERAGITPESLNGRAVLEVCAGTGFLTFHLLERANPNLTVNDISANEMASARKLIKARHPSKSVEWILEDMHTVEFERKFDVIIGNSFMHHFYNVPHVLARFSELLNPGGVFISLHEPTPMSTVVEAAKLLVWPLAVVAPKLVNDIARSRYKGEPSPSDLWMFDEKSLVPIAKQAGFRSMETYAWGLVRPIVVQRHGLHTSQNKPELSDSEIQTLREAVKADALLNRYLPKRCFGSLCIVCRK